MAETKQLPSLTSIQSMCIDMDRTVFVAVLSRFASCLSSLFTTYINTHARTDLNAFRYVYMATNQLQKLMFIYRISVNQSILSTLMCCVTGFLHGRDRFFLSLHFWSVKRTTKQKSTSEINVYILVAYGDRDLELRWNSFLTPVAYAQICLITWCINLGESKRSEKKQRINWKPRNR